MDKLVVGVGDALVVTYSGNPIARVLVERVGKKTFKTNNRMTWTFDGFSYPHESYGQYAIRMWRPEDEVPLLQRRVKRDIESLDVSRLPKNLLEDFQRLLNAARSAGGMVRK